MSHTVTMEVEFKPGKALENACKRLDGVELRELSSSNLVSLYQSDSKFTEGHAIKLPGWTYEVVLDKDGKLHFDNFNGRWGKIEELNKVKQMYAVEAAKIEARKQGFMIREVVKDGNIQLELTQ